MHNSVCEGLYKRKGAKEFNSLIKDFLLIYVRSFVKIEVLVKKPQSSGEPFCVFVKGISNDYGNIKNFENKFNVTDVSFEGVNHSLDGAWRKFLYNQLRTPQEKKQFEESILHCADNLCLGSSLIK